jgi:hypothetical protein
VRKSLTSHLPLHYDYDDDAFEPPARGGDFSIKRCSSNSEVSPAVPPKDNKAVPALRSHSKKTKNGNKKGDDAGKSFRLLQVVLHKHTLLQDFSFVFPTHPLPSAAQNLGVGLRRPCRGRLLAVCLGDGARYPFATRHAMFNDHILAGSCLVLSPIV